MAEILKYSMLHCNLGLVKDQVLVSFMTGVCSS